MKRILIVEDDAEIRMMLRRMLEMEEFIIDEAVNGTDALRQYQKTPPDLIITDIVMPEKEGLELITELRKQNSEIKIIAISGGGRLVPESYLQLAEKMGAQDTVLKPFTQKSIMKAINNVMEVA